MTGPTDPSKTRPTQLMPAGTEADKALQGFLHIMGFNPGNVDGDFGGTSKTAYDQARTQYAFLPELSANPDQAAMTEVFRAIDRALQTDTAFQQRYLQGVRSETNVTELQGALVAGGSWANRHLGDRISNAETIRIDGDRGTLTTRATRNAATLTGIATMQSSLNLLSDAGLTPNGTLDTATLGAMQNYAQRKNIAWDANNIQENFRLIMESLQTTDNAALRTRVAEVLNADTDYRAPDARTLDAQIVMNGFARQQGLDIRTAPDGRQTDTRITPENSHTRTMIAPQTGVELTGPKPTEEPAGPTAVAAAEPEPAAFEPPFGLNATYRVTRADVLREVQSIADRQNANPDSAEHILAYSEESRGFLLISRNETEGRSMVYQISDRNVGQIMSGINDGSIAMDLSARKYIAVTVHGNQEETAAYGAEELRDAFAENATRFTSGTREGLLTTSARLTNGDTLTFGLDDLHDALGKIDSKRDWSGEADPVVMRDYIRELRDAAKDAREERYVNIPEYPGGELTAENSVELNIGGQTTRVPAEVWTRIAGSLETQRGFSTGRNASSLETVSVAPAPVSATTNPDGAGSGELRTSFTRQNTVFADDIVAENAADIDIAADEPAVEELELAGGPEATVRRTTAVAPT